MLVPSELGVEVLGFLVVILVDGGRLQLRWINGADVGIGVSWREGLDGNESSFGAREGLIGGVNLLGDNAGNDALEHLEHSFRGPGFLKLREAVGDPRVESFAGAGLAVVATRV